MRSQQIPAAPSLRIGILVTPAFTLNALANFVDVLRLASDEGDASGAIHCRYELMSATGRPERASCGYLMDPTSPLIVPSKLDYIAIVGGLLYRGRSLDARACEYLRQADDAHVPLVGICTGSFVLYRLGLMKGRKVCVSWFHHHDFIAEFPHAECVADMLFVPDDDRVTTSGGVGAALVAAELVGRHISRDMARKALRIMQITPPSGNLQAASPFTPKSASNLVRRAMLLMEQNIGDALSIQTIALKLDVSRRSLERQFSRDVNESPKACYLKLRLQHARRLRQSGHSLQQIAMETGFASSAHLSVAFQRRFGQRLAEHARCGRIQAATTY